MYHHIVTDDASSTTGVEIAKSTQTLVKAKSQSTESVAPRTVPPNLLASTTTSIQQITLPIRTTNEHTLELSYFFLNQSISIHIAFISRGLSLSPVSPWRMKKYGLTQFTELTHWGQDKMTTILNAFSWMQMCEFRFRFHWSLFLRVQLTTFLHWFR